MWWAVEHGIKENTQLTRLNLNKPTSNQLIAPIMAKIKAIILVIFMFLSKLRKLSLLHCGLFTFLKEAARKFKIISKAHW